MNEFIEQYADSIICEPSGLTYTDLKEQTTQKIMIVNNETINQSKPCSQDEEEHKKIIDIIDEM
jgi:hypothetical protein